MKELVHLSQGAVTWSQAVGKVADALNPLGAARDIVAVLGACYVEIQQIDLQRQLARQRHQILSDYLERRQLDVAEIFLASEQQARAHEVNTKAILDTITIVTSNARDPYLSSDERMIHANLIPILTGQVVAMTQIGVDKVVRLAEVLNLGNMQLAIERRDH